MLASRKQLVFIKNHEALANEWKIVENELNND